jgi:hypothetical protein
LENVACELMNDVEEKSNQLVMRCNCIIYLSSYVDDYESYMGYTSMRTFFKECNREQISIAPSQNHKI